MKSLSFLVCLLVVFIADTRCAGNKMIPKGTHIVWHDGGQEYFAIFENGMLYSLHREDNSYQKIHKVKDKALVEKLFHLAKSTDFVEMHPPLNRETILENDQDYKHIELRKDGRKYEVYWSDKDEEDEPNFLAKLLEELMSLV